MPRLTTNYSESLLTLIRSNDAPIDGVEVGPWLRSEKIRRIQQEFPDWPIQFHAGSFITRYRYWRGVLDRLTEYNSCTQSEWISLHIELLPIWVFLLSSRFGFHLNPPKAKQASDSFVRTLLQLKEVVELPIILENLPSLHQEKYAYAAEPSAISDIVRKTDSGLLLDIAHARVAASYRRMSVEAYLEKLPLERTKQIHVSGARVKDGYLQDTHEAMQDEDYSILKWVLGNSEPEVVTLEYFRELDSLQEQIWRLREMVPRQ